MGGHRGGGKENTSKFFVDFAIQVHELIVLGRGEGVHQLTRRDTTGLVLANRTEKEAAKV